MRSSPAVRGRDRRLFAEIFKMMFAMISDFHRVVAVKEIDTSIVIAHRAFGDMLRLNPHYHALLLEGGFDESSRENLAICFSERLAEYGATLSDGSSGESYDKRHG